MSKEVANAFGEALRKLEEEGEVEASGGTQAEDRAVDNVSFPEAFGGGEGLREFWRAIVHPVWP